MSLCWLNSGLEVLQSKERRRCGALTASFPSTLPGKHKFTSGQRLSVYSEKKNLGHFCSERDLKNGLFPRQPPSPVQQLLHEVV